MNERRHSTIQDYLQQADAQERIQDHMRQAQSNMAVTISRAARLFGFSESQLREWEKRGLLRTERPLLSPDGKATTGHRQYSVAELFKLAIIRDLIDQGYGPGEIPLDIDKLWERTVGAQNRTFPGQTHQTLQLAGEGQKSNQLSINAHIESTDLQEFWRYFVGQVLRLTLLLICEDLPDTPAGLILPLEDRKLAGSLRNPDDLKQVGRSLVGWLERSRSFYLFLTDAPGFDYPTDYRLQTLKAGEGQEQEEDRVLDNTFIVLARGTRRVPLAPDVQEVVTRLLALVYERAQSWEPALAYGARDWFYQAHDFSHMPPGIGNRVYNALLERVIELGGKTDDGRDRWDFCALLVPDDINLPLQQQSLIVQSQTQRSPFIIGHTTISPQRIDQANSITLKAFEGSQIVYQSLALPGDSMLSPQSVQVITSTPEMVASGQAGRLFHAPPPDEAVHSALAVPIVGEYSISTAVFYIEANEAYAFSLADQRVLRLISRMLGELLQASRVRGQDTLSREMLASSPAIVDSTFLNFAVEADFIAALDALLVDVREGIAGHEDEEVSIISVDIDNQSSLAMKYGNRIARNLSEQVGSRIRRSVSSAGSYQLFHISADKYYVLLKGVPLNDARELAMQLRSVLSMGKYRILPISGLSGRAILPGNMLELADAVTTHIGVSSYTLKKLDELLKRYPTTTALRYVTTLILAGIEEMLERGKLAGGNCVVAWDRQSWGYKVLS